MIAIARKDYWNFAEHRRYQEHYFSCERGGHCLAFCADFRRHQMPGDMTASGHKRELTGKLFDVKTGNDYVGRIVVAYEHYERRQMVVDDEWNRVYVESLQPYFYEWHWCGCHRAQDIQNEGLSITGYHDVELESAEVCPTGRFQVSKLYWEQRPELILYSELFSQDELESSLMDLREA